MGLNELITRRSQVQILPPPLKSTASPEPRFRAGAVLGCGVKRVSNPIRVANQRLGLPLLGGPHRRTIQTVRCSCMDRVRRNAETRAASGSRSAFFGTVVDHRAPGQINTSDPRCRLGDARESVIYGRIGDASTCFTDCHCGAGLGCSERCHLRVHRKSAPIPADTSACAVGDGRQSR
jgi:hypothetical protein